MILDFLRCLGETRAKLALVATFDFDPTFFERRILPSRAFETAGRIVVFMDEGRYRELLSQGRQGPQFDRRYFVIPIRCEGGVFHPKLYLAVGDKGCFATVGSNNCTASGTGHNLELISTFKATLVEESPPIREALCASVFQLFRRYAQDAGPMAQLLEEEVFDPISEEYPWLHEAGSLNDPDGIELLSNHETSLWRQTLDRLGSMAVQRVTLCAPFFDENLSIIDRIKAVWPAAAIEVIAQPYYSNLPSAKLQSLKARYGDLHLTAVTPRSAGRNVHAKALAFETAGETYWLTGSANLSYAALLGGNREACLWFSTFQRAAEVLKHEDLTVAQMAPEDFQEAPIEEPLPRPEPGHGLRIMSATLSEDGELKGAIQVPFSLMNLRVKLVRLGEQHPFLSLAAGTAREELKLLLNGEQLRSFDRPVSATLQGELAGETVTSSPVSVAQLSQLLRDRRVGGGAGNRLRKIAETGEGLNAYLASLSSVDDVIDFMKSVNIRFDDGAYSGGLAAQRWRRRDPFSGDIPESWLLGSSGGSVEELRDAIWDFVQRHVQTRLHKHTSRGNLNGLPNFLDIYRTLVSLLLSYHAKVIDGQNVLPAPFVTKGLQDVLRSLVGSIQEDDSDQLGFTQAAPLDVKEDGFAQAIRMNLREDTPLLTEQLERHRVAATVIATVEELIRVRSVAVRCSPNDKWSQARRKWVFNWIAAMGLASPNESELGEVGAEFRIAA